MLLNRPIKNISQGLVMSNDAGKLALPSREYITFLNIFEQNIAVVTVFLVKQMQTW